MIILLERDFWVDPVYELVGISFSVELIGDPHDKRCADLFANTMTAAVND